MVQVTGSLARYPARASFLWYASFIACGTMLLKLPAASAPDRKPISLSDALFTATSAACVTGLTVRSTPDDFSFFGQAVIITLVQLGGIGIMTVTTFVIFQLGARGGLRQRALMAATLGTESTSDLSSILRRVLALTFLVEGIGFVILSVRNLVDLPWRDALWHAFFHSISAFCNAGFALFDDSLTRYEADPIVNAVISALVMIGGIGFPVILDIRRHWTCETWTELWDHLQLHSKIMLLGSSLLWVTGAIVFLAIEWDGVLDEKPIWEWPIIACSYSVTCRTAGFNTIDIRALSNAMLFITMLLMAIGGGPCSTAGGAKVSTASLLVLRAWSTFSGFSRVNVFRRTIPHDGIEKATATAMLFVVVGAGALTMLLLVEQAGPPQNGVPMLMESPIEDAETEKKIAEITGEPATSEKARGEAIPEREYTPSFIDACFEVTSALGTVGLSTGMTPLLSPAGRMIIICCMFLGRLGPISVFAALSRQERPDPLEHPAEEPLLG